MHKLSDHQQAYEAKKLSKTIWMQSSPVIVYNSRRSTLLYLVACIALLTSVLVTYFTFYLDKSNPPDAYISTFSFYVWQVFFLLAGNSMTVAVLWLSGKYILQMKVVPGKVIEITTWNLIKGNRTKLIPFHDFTQLKDKAGLSLLPGTPLVIAPYTMLRTNKRSFLLDQSGDFPQGILLVYQLFN